MGGDKDGIQDFISNQRIYNSMVYCKLGKRRITQYDRLCLCILEFIQTVVLKKKGRAAKDKHGTPEEKHILL